ncbi:permease-like cell division protein FtsX [Nonomuraea typhae]|uniref:Permease-like cell division protein FtsX n=1 Tax=Nonomuraea typhae TaxID=2603600 RepID=A0ABW7Z013_9ACTN
MADGPLPTPDAPWPTTGRMRVSLCFKDDDSKNCRGRAVTAEQKRKLETLLKRLPGVSKVRFESQREAYQGFREQFADDEGLLNAVRVSDMPETFLAHLNVPDLKLRARLERVPGVSWVYVHRTDFWAGKADAKVVLCSPKNTLERCQAQDAITDQARDAVFAALRTVTGVKTIYLESHRHAAQNRLWTAVVHPVPYPPGARKPTFKEALRLTGETFHLVLSDPSDFDRIRPALKGIAGWESIIRHR